MHVLYTIVNYSLQTVLDILNDFEKKCPCCCILDLAVSFCATAEAGDNAL